MINSLTVSRSNVEQIEMGKVGQSSTTNTQPGGLGFARRHVSVRSADYSDYTYLSALQFINKKNHH